MRSLFFKIFLWFWLANILVVGVLTFTMGRPGDPMSAQFHGLVGDVVDMYGQRLVNAYQAGGQAALEASATRTQDDTGIRVFVVNEAGDDIARRPLPEGMSELVTRARQTGATVLQHHFDSGLLAARPVGRPESGRYVSIAALPGPAFQPFGSSYRNILRLLAVVSMAGLLCYGLAHHLTAPLRRLRSSARQLASGDLNARVGRAVDKRHDEIGGLARDFDHMAERIGSLVSTQQRLLLDMSHELRSPLARLNLALGLAAQRAGADAQSALDRIGREATRLNDLIERMLVLARLENTEAAGDLIAVDLAAMVRDIAVDTEFEARGNRRDAALVRCDACCVLGVPQLLRSAIENVVRNALRYTPEGTRVEMSLCVDNEPTPHGTIWVRDRGPGVPDELMEEIFRPFCRVGKDRDRQTGGVGLGLAIAKAAVRLHGGTIFATNTSGGGLIVQLTFPLLAATTRVEVAS